MCNAASPPLHSGLTVGAQSSPDPLSPLLFLFSSGEGNGTTGGTGKGQLKMWQPLDIVPKGRKLKTNLFDARDGVEHGRQIAITTDPSTISATSVTSALC